MGSFINLTRIQLAKFLPDQESIRKFEEIIKLVNQLDATTISTINAAIIALGVRIDDLKGSDIELITTAFNSILSAADTDAQKAFETIDNLTTTNIPEGTKLFYTNERVDDRVNDLIQDGDGIAWDYDDALGTLTGNTVWKKTGTVLSPATSTDSASVSGGIAIPSDTNNLKLGAGSDASMGYDGTNGVINTSLVAPSDLNIQCGTDKTVVLSEPVWVDLDFPIIIRTTGANIPTLTTLQGNITAPQWQVNDFNVCEGQELIHKWSEGTPLYWHVHMITNGLDATARYVRFEVEYCWVNVNGVLSASATIDSLDLLIPANTPAKTMMLMSIGNFTPTGGKIGGHVYARLRRIASVGSAPGSDPWITMLQAHILVDTIGSRQISAK